MALACDRAAVLASAMKPALQIPAVMDVAEFLAWNAPARRRWQLLDGEPRAMAPASRTCHLIQSELNRLIGNHLAGEWPDRPAVIEDGMLELCSIGFAAPVTALYRDTRLERATAPG